MWHAGFRIGRNDDDRTAVVLEAEYLGVAHVQATRHLFSHHQEHLRLTDPARDQSRDPTQRRLLPGQHAEMIGELAQIVAAGL